METWFNNWRIRTNELKSKHVTFTLRKLIILGNQESKTVYLGIHLDRRLTWRSRIEAKQSSD